jgi:phosphoketolase
LSSTVWRFLIIIFAFHGYPSLIHQLTYRRTNHRNLHAGGYKEEGTTTTPFDMVVINDMDRYHLVMDVIGRVPGLIERASDVRQTMVDKPAEHKSYVSVRGEDIPEITDWRWGDGTKLYWRSICALLPTAQSNLSSFALSVCRLLQVK